MHVQALGPWPSAIQEAVCVEGARVSAHLSARGADVMRASAPGLASRFARVNCRGALSSPHTCLEKAACLQLCLWDVRVRMHRNVRIRQTACM